MFLIPIYIQNAKSLSNLISLYALFDVISSQARTLEQKEKELQESNSLNSEVVVPTRQISNKIIEFFKRLYHLANT